VCVCINDITKKVIYCATNVEESQETINV